jgi:hypothetical protein
MPDTLCSSHAVATPYVLYINTSHYTSHNLQPPFCFMKHKGQNTQTVVLCVLSVVCGVQDGVLRGPEMEE